ncbi:MAG TPA: ATP-binding protein [candidate division WOR-3 bacterium]|uniref:ATP-binding protein n=1 Tax=candidate division WOR-3 bacterium TaxID=2052148 RepID=A0A7V0XFM2_UNCW3|nr:ATP-binding protein [candidate division WOR-3 bacterium]
MTKLELRNIGQLREAAVEFGDLTILVGPQASGKSIFLQFLKLHLDSRKIVADLRKHGLVRQRDISSFLGLYLGEGMSGLWSNGPNGSQVTVDNTAVDMTSVLRIRLGKHEPEEVLFYIPAQRVLALNQQGWWRPFSDYRPNDPYIARAFSENIRILMEQGRFTRAEGGLFPRSSRLKREIRDELDRAVFHGFGLTIDDVGGQKRLVLVNRGAKYPFMVWSAGQREFVPLLLGLYWLMPPARVSRRAQLQWAVIEEVEMGLHPKAISAVMIAVLDLVSRGYRVVLSTHSPHVLDVVWAIRTIQQHQAGYEPILKMFGLERTQPTQKLAERVLQATYRSFYFNPVPTLAPTVTDISELDPGSADAAVAGWGGLSEFSGRIADIVARVVADAEHRGEE